MRFQMRTSIFSLILLTALTGCVVNAPPVAERTPDGLVRVQNRQVDTVYAVPGVSLAPYKKVMLDTVELAFKLDWQKRHPEVSESDVTRIRSQGAAVFYEIFSSALTQKNGYPLVTQPGPDVLRVTASITELDVGSTLDSVGNKRLYVVDPSALTLSMELRDSTTGALLVRAIDKEKGRAVGNLQVVDAVSNSAEARRALEMWAGLLRGALDGQRNAPPAP
jgi:hypothetical protein